MPTDPATLIACAVRVIGQEAAALERLAQSVGSEFAGAVDLLLAVQGRVIVSGMGKSGHIARKIAATFASTGTPAHFVHPAEASHGDLGMMATGDVVLLLSNSGETPELANIIAYTRRFDIALIGVSGRPGSTLLRQCDVAIQLPAVDEACGTGVVPSSSTTMMLALGDALAIVLMQHRRFTPQNFRDFHPGGTLGSRLTRVGDLMHRGAEMPLVGRSTPMSEVLLSITQKGFGVAGVVDAAGALVGVITDGDLRRHMDGLLAMPADAVMTPMPLTISADSLAELALAIMNRRKITCLFVINPAANGVPAGILHIHDCLRAGVA